MARTAIVVMNLGGPHNAAAVEPFLFNLFSDPAIIALPNPLRWAIAKLIARRRAPLAREIYAKIGNSSPLLANTTAQANALQGLLGGDYRVFTVMRYWKPQALDVAKAVKAWNPEEIILLPLYPQYSSTTTGSSLEDWLTAAEKLRIRTTTRAICCYPEEPGFIAALAQNIDAALRAWDSDIGPPRLLLSAHGLPKRVIAKGDPYQSQVERTAAAVIAKLARRELESVVCYQSRVGPLEWIGPATDAEIRRAGTERRGLIVAPIAFVSEHSETLVELDIEYRHLGSALGVPRYERVPTVGTAPDFIAGLAALVGRTRKARQAIVSAEAAGSCGPDSRLCACRSAA